MSSEWFNRPDDERYLSLDDLWASVKGRSPKTPLSTTAHKLATIILDGIAWKDRYSGLERGTAAFTLAHLADKMGMSRQHLTALLAELAASTLELVRRKPNGKFAPWLFQYGAAKADAVVQDVVSATSDTPIYMETKNKTIFAGRVEIGSGTSVYLTPWADLIKAAEASLACWNLDAQVIWKRFLTFNRSRGNAAVPAGFLLGFMRRRRSSLPDAATTHTAEFTPERSVEPKEQELRDLIRAAPGSNRQFHASDLSRLIGLAPMRLEFLTSFDSSDAPSSLQSLRYTAALQLQVGFQLDRTLYLRCCRATDESNKGPANAENTLGIYH